MATLYMSQRRHKDKDTLMTSKEDVRDNVIHYDDEGGGEADTHAFDIGTLRTTQSTRAAGITSNGYGDGVLLHLARRYDDVRSPDIHRQTASVIAASPRGLLTEGGAGTMGEFMEQQQGYVAPPYDSLATYAYEGDGSVVGSLSSIDGTWVIDESGDFSSLGDWGFKTLASILDRRPPPAAES